LTRAGGLTAVVTRASHSIIVIIFMSRVADKETVVHATNNAVAVGIDGTTSINVVPFSNKLAGKYDS
jgi:hypothetical protein